MVISADRQQVLRLIEAEAAQVVDVLPRREYDESHIPGAISIPLRQLTGETVSALSRDKSVVVYCHDGL
jgi:rhodanese-related sulfurtransferase